MKSCNKCKKQFEPKVNWQKYCSPKCRNHNSEKSARTKAFQQNRRDQINQFKLDSGCSKCGYNAHPAALQFNHVAGNKQFNVSQDLKRKWNNTIEEIAKCEVLCANCHAIHSFENNHGWTKRKAKNVS
jgi:hypothetical protein